MELKLKVNGVKIEDLSDKTDTFLEVMFCTKQLNVGSDFGRSSLRKWQYVVKVQVLR